MNPDEGRETDAPEDFPTCWPFPSWDRPRPALPAPTKPPPPELGEALM